MAGAELVTVKIEARSEIGVDLLPDVLRQLGAMVRLLTEFAYDPRYSKVEVMSIDKHSPLQATLRVVTVKERPKVKGAERRRPTVRGSAQPIRRLERAYASAKATDSKRVSDATGLTVLADVAKQLKSDVAVIQTANETLTIDSSLIEQINRKLGVVHRSRGSVTGILEGLNVHSKPWSFTVYPEIGPARIRCNFTEQQFADVQSGIRKVVRVHGLKDYVADSPWPIRIQAERVEVLAEAQDQAWIELVDALSTLWDQAEEDERLMILEEQFA